MLHKPEPLGWTEARIERLKALYNEGAPYSQIAAELGGGLTKNAIAGKVHHLKLAKREPVARKPHGNKGRPKANAIVHRVAAKKAQAPKVEVLPVEPIPEEEGVDVTRLIGIMDLKHDTCRYPHGDPLEAGFGFCGRPVKAESVYCPEHHQRCYGVRA